uniref:Neurofilament medium polypeptide-like n=1 Tax=Nicotiana sylvestris TaxID=4096 RepID=A0A1U7VD16_NICSY|nr:PREDICTED: neurofilament medium polypeptide-like [Nicotiana sylvestris]
MRLAFAKSVREPGALDTALVTEPTLPTPTSPNPKPESQPPSASSPTQSSTGFHRSRKTLTLKKFVAVTSPFASLKIMVEEDKAEGEENQEISSLPAEESSAKEQGVSHTSDESTMTALGFDSTGNVPLMPPEVSTIPAPSPHFYAEPLSIVVLEMRSLSEEENKDNEEEDYDNVALASFISSRSIKVTPKESTSKRPITRLQKKEELEFVLNKSKEEKEIGERWKVEEVSGEKVVELSGEKLVDEYSEKVVQEYGERVVEESAEKVSKKSTNKGKSVRKLVKGKVGANEEPGSSKKAKVGAT